MRQSHRVTDFVRNRRRDILGAPGSNGIREDVAILLCRAKGPDVSDAAAAVAGTADDDAHRVRRSFKNGLVGRDGNVIGRVILCDIQINLIDELKLFCGEGRRIAVDVIRRMKLAAPAGIAICESAKVQIDHVRRFRNAAGDRETVHFNRRVVDIYGAELFVRVNRYAGLVVRRIPGVHRVQNETFGRVGLTD